VDEQNAAVASASGRANRELLEVSGAAHWKIDLLLSFV
tara:strand:+ start:511 stop:624 length:114 start_codon:yes stop_codon:yes gene_type:complete